VLLPIRENNSTEFFTGNARKRRSSRKTIHADCFSCLLLANNCSIVHQGTGNIIFYGAIRRGSTAVKQVTKQMGELVFEKARFATKVFNHLHV